MKLKGYNALVVLGPTASGKTRLGVRLANMYDGEIVSADSRQVYRGLNIGAGKDLDEYEAGGKRIPYHLIDIADLNEEFSVFDYQKAFYAVFDSLTRRKTLPVVVGGTGLYLEAVLQKYRMVEVPMDAALRAELAELPSEAIETRLRSLKRALHNTTDLADRERLVRALEIAEYSSRHAPLPAPDIRPLILGVAWDRERLRARIHARLEERLDAGMIAETEGLHARGVPWERLERLGLEYRFLAEYLQGKIRNKNDLLQKLYSAICQFAKRQETWFRRMERNGVRIHWTPEADFDAARKIIHDSEHA